MRTDHAWDLARRALEQHVLPVVGTAFQGAYIMGSLARCSADDDFNERASDIDLAVVVDDQAIDAERYPHGTFVLSGPCLVQILYSPPLDATDDRLLTTLGLGSNLRHGQVLADPYGAIAAAQSRVLAEWGKPHWVAVRTERAIAFAHDAVDAAGRATADPARVGVLVDLLVQLGGLIAIASAETPTHRKSLILARRLLDGEAGIVDRMLAAARVTDASADDAAAAITDAHAAALIETALPQPMFAADVGGRLADATAEGLRELVELGFRAEAVLNAAGGVAMSALVVGDLGTDDDRRAVAPLLYRRAASLQIDQAGWPSRVTELADLAQDVFAIARRIAA